MLVVVMEMKVFRSRVLPCTQQLSSLRTDWNLGSARSGRHHIGTLFSASRRLQKPRRTASRPPPSLLLFSLLWLLLLFRGVEILDAVCRVQLFYDTHLRLSLSFFLCYHCFFILLIRHSCWETDATGYGFVSRSFSTFFIFFQLFIFIWSWCRYFWIL